MHAQAKWKVLNRYELVDPLVSDHSDQTSESWIAVGEYEVEYLVKLWPFQTDEPDDLQRALWDAELRTIYRVGSSPGAEKTILVIRDAGLDRTRRCFVMVMHAAEASGYDTLEELLKRRKEFPWLRNASVEARRELWMGLRRIAQGIQLLHSQDVLHRNVGAESIFLHKDHGPSSFRLGGFEWSVRVGELHLKQSSTGSMGWSIPPELSTPEASGYLPETDWYGFGMLAVRCLLSVGDHLKFSPLQRHGRIMKAIEQAPELHLSDIERSILQRLIARNNGDRLMRGYEVVAAIDDLLASLGRGAQTIEKPLLLAYNPTVNQSLIEEAIEEGFIPNPTKPQESFNPRDLVHCANLSAFIGQDLTEAQLYALSDYIYVLVGKRLQLRITRLEERDRFTRDKTYTWDIAYCLDVADLRWNEGGTACKELPPNSIIVRTTSEVQPLVFDRARAQSWERYLPHIDESEKLRANLAQFHNFIRCTNQMELLMRDAELFQYEVVKRYVEKDTETLEIREAIRERPVAEVLQLEGGLVQFLQREIESGKKNCRLVVLSPDYQDALKLNSEKKIEAKDCFQVENIKMDDRVVVLKRGMSAGASTPPPDKGCLRTFGMFGQVALIRRRTDAINRLESHSYLLRSLSATGQVFMDTGETSLPQPLSTDRVDETKQMVMQDILRTRPIYALQGPPGTGKTTMVAHLLRQIFKDDPVAQVLITAQAHGAVDVLRGKVRNEAFDDVNEENQPLAIRLGGGDAEETILEGSVESVASQILGFSIKRLDEAALLTRIQDEWRQHARKMQSAIDTRSTGQDATEFCELVKQGANITYCTTSASDLEELAKDTQSFDWTIIEEAGKCHGFDLALPLQAGHRWLLIGDQNQLSPYRFEDYSKALVSLDQMVQALKELPNRAGGLLDSEWINQWDDMGENEQNEFKEFAKHWLNTFESIFVNCKFAPSGSEKEKLTIEKSIGAAAGMLSRQYRMHPTIGDLISKVYYESELKNQTVDINGNALENVVLPVACPEIIRDVAIVWLDTPAASHSDNARELGPEDGKSRYINPFEVNVIRGFLKQLRLKSNLDKPIKLAILSPYAQQVALIKRSLKDILLPQGLELKEELRNRQAQTPVGKPRFAHTVDSFQGNEADITIISLVRNNKGDRVKPFGFLEDASRMNVLISRAQRLLVLIGSWDFFHEQVARFPQLDPLRTESHLKEVITILEEYFNSGKAVKLDAEVFVEVGE